MLQAYVALKVGHYCRYNQYFLLRYNSPPHKVEFQFPSQGVPSFLNFSFRVQKFNTLISNLSILSYGAETFQSVTAWELDSSSSIMVNGPGFYFFYGIA
jgi:hypothetical protein